MSEEENDYFISVEEARRIMGSDALGMTDEEIRNLISVLDNLSRAYVEQFMANGTLSKHRV